MSVHYGDKPNTRGKRAFWNITLWTETRTVSSLKLEACDTNIFNIQTVQIHISEARNFRELNLVRIRTQRKSPRVTI